jgi:UMF1 family MFS transporter
LTVGTAGVAVALLGPLFGAVADRCGRRKPWLGTFAGVCIVATALLWFVRPSQSMLVLAMVLVWFGTVGTELAAVFYNAMLPAIVDKDRVGRWSGWGWALGYAGGLCCLLVALFGCVREGAWLDLNREAAFHIRATFILVAGWYAVFALPLFMFTPDDPSRGKTLRQGLREGLGQLRESVRNVRQHLTILRFLIARMIYIDGLATLFAFGGVYAAGTFDMSEQKVLVFGIVLNVAAGLGAFLFSFVDDRIGSRNTILLSLCGLILPGIGMLLVTSQVAFWVLGGVLGIFVGPVQAASRSYLARAAPDELRNQMFGLYALSGKATAFAGPLIVGGATHLTGSQRIGMSAIMVLLAVGALLAWGLPRAEQAADS